MSFQFDTTPVHRELVLRFSFVLLRVGLAVVGRRVEIGWEGGSADGSERHGKVPRLKPMRFHPSFSLHRFLFPLSSRFAIRMKMWIVVRVVGGGAGGLILSCLGLSCRALSCPVLWAYFVLDWLVLS